MDETARTGPQDRIGSLEQRVAALERALLDRGAAPRRAGAAAAGPPPVPLPVPLEPPQPPPQPPRRPAPVASARGFDLERFFGLAVLGRIGIAALVLAAAWFGQLGWGYLGPSARVVAIYAGAAALVAAGALLRPRVAPRYVALLWGGAVALGYLAGVVARRYYDLVPAGTAVLQLAGAAAVGQLLALSLRRELLATIALGGAYAAPLIVGAASPGPTPLFLYVAVLR